MPRLRLHPAVSGALLRAAAMAAVAALAVPAAAVAQGQGLAMPDPAQMSGIPLPAGDLPNSAVSIRVIRGSIANNITGQTVELHGGPTVLTLETDANGRVEFMGVAPGTNVHAVTVVNAQRIESQTFPVPSMGGVKVMLVATDAATTGRAAEDQKLAAGPAVRGTVVLGAQTQFVVEVQDDLLQVFYLLQILNTARTPVETDPLVFNLPPDARGANILEGSSPLATAGGSRVTVAGPFPPGATAVQAAYELPYSGADVTISQTLPATLEQLSLVVQKVGTTHVESAQLANHSEMPADGKTYIAGSGPAIAAGQALTFAVTGLPHRPLWPRNVTLALAAAIFGVGLWLAVSRGHGANAADERRKTLQERRNRLFENLLRLEEQHRAGQVDEKKYGSRRRDLVGQLERIYSELDQGLAA